MNPDCLFQNLNSKIKKCKIPRLFLLSLIGILKYRASKFAKLNHLKVPGLTHCSLLCKQNFEKKRY